MIQNNYKKFFMLVKYPPDTQIIVVKPLILVYVFS